MHVFLVPVTTIWCHFWEAQGIRTVESIRKLDLSLAVSSCSTEARFPANQNFHDNNQFRIYHLMTAAAAAAAAMTTTSLTKTQHGDQYEKWAFCLEEVLVEAQERTSMLKPKQHPDPESSMAFGWTLKELVRVKGVKDFKRAFFLQFLLV